MNIRKNDVKDMIENVHILVATPSIFHFSIFINSIDHFINAMTRYSISLSNLLFFILDEADQ